MKRYRVKYCVELTYDLEVEASDKADAETAAAELLPDLRAGGFTPKMSEKNQGMGAAFDVEEITHAKCRRCRKPVKLTDEHEHLSLDDVECDDCQDVTAAEADVDARIDRERGA